MLTRREIISAGALLAGTAMISKLGAAQGADVNTSSTPSPSSTPPETRFPPGEPGKDYTPVYTPNGATLEWKVVDGVKVFHLIAEEFEHEFAPGLKARCWGYNGRTPGPTIEVVEGDRVRFYITNRLAAPTTVHWHGILLPNGMDGVSGLTQKAIEPGETCKYEFTLRQHGTAMYHSHYDEMTQQALGLMGMIVIHPRNPKTPRPDRDFVLQTSEWKIVPGTSRPDPNEMTDFNVLTFNGKCYPGTAPLVVKVGDRVRIRLGNLSAMEHHSLHLHGYQFKVVETDGGQIPESAQYPEITVLVSVGSTRTIEFIADVPGDWAFHCHMSHHAMTQMGHDLPNMIGVQAGELEHEIRTLLPQYMAMGSLGMGGMGNMGMAVPANSLPMGGAEGPFSYIDMGGMFTVLKARQEEVGYDDPGWYKHPEGTLSTIVTDSDMARDGIDPNAEPGPGTRPTRPGNHPPLPAPTKAASTPPPASQPQAFWTCTMHPEIIRAKPGSCPICGMKLVIKKG